VQKKEDEVRTIIKEDPPDVKATQAVARTTAEGEKRHV
jgi:hypothetical protein